MQDIDPEKDLPVKMQPRSAASVIPPCLMVNVAAESPPPILFWSSESCLIVPDWPPEAVSSKEQEDLGTVRAEAPKNKERVIKEFMIEKVCIWNVSNVRCDIMICAL